MRLNVVLHKVRIVTEFHMSKHNKILLYSMHLCFAFFTKVLGSVIII